MSLFGLINPVMHFEDVFAQHHCTNKRSNGDNNHPLHHPALLPNLWLR